MTDGQRREWDRLRQAARQPAKRPPGPQWTLLAAFGFFAGGVLGMFGTLPLLLLVASLGERVDPLTPLSLALVTAPAGAVSASVLGWVEDQEDHGRRRPGAPR